MAIIKKNDIIDVDGVVKDLNTLQTELDKLIKLEQQLIKTNKELQKETRTTAKTGTGAEAKKRIDLTNKLVVATKDLTDTQKRKQQIDLERLKLTEKLNKSNSDRIQRNVELRLQLQKQNKINKELARETLGLVKDYEKLTKQTNEAQKAFKNTAVQFGVNSKEAKKARKEFLKLDNKLRSVNDAAKDGRRDVGRYHLALKNLSGQLLGSLGIVAGLDSVVRGIAAFGQKAKEMSKLTRQVTKTFNVAEKEAKKLASSISAIASSFDKDYNEVMNAANTVSKEFGISGKEALDLIEEGFKKGSDNSGEFIDILKEYPTQLKSIGLSAKESFAIINQQVTSGVYSDKGIDALKEGGLRLRENTDAVQAALKPLDESVKLEIERNVAAGDTFKAMQLISKQLKDNNLTIAQQQAIMADVFGGAGEDALSFVRNLDDVKLSLDDVANQTSVVEDAQLQLNEKWSEFVIGIEDGSGIISQAWAGLQNAASNLLEQLINLNNGVNAYTDVQKDAAGFSEVLKGQLSDVVDLIEKGTTATEKSNRALILRGQLQRDLAEQQFKLQKFIDIGADDAEQNARLEIERIETLINKTNEYVEVQKEVNVETEEQQKIVIKLTAAQKKQLEQEKKLNAERERRRKIQEQLGGGDELVGRLEGTQVKDATDITKEINAANDELNRINFEKRLEEEVARQKQIEDAKLTVKQEAEKAFVQFASDLTSDFVDERLQQEIDAAEAEKKVLEDKLDKGLISEEQFNDELAKINRKQREAEAKAEKKKALFDIAIATAVAVAKAGFITPGAFAALAAGAIQAGLVAARPIPKFEKGEVNIKGKRHSEGGILGEFEGGESIINRKGTANAPKLLEGINNGLIRDIDYKGLTKNQRDGLTASLLMKGNQQNDQIITALSNLGYSFEHNGKIHIFKGNGEVLKKIK